MLNNIILFLLLFGVWVVLSGFFSPFFIFLGVISCLAAVFFSIKMRDPDSERKNLLPLVIKFPAYLFWIMKEITSSSIDVGLKMWQLEPEISPEMAWVSTNIKGDLGLTIYGTSITLTPGTVATAVRGEGMIQVHALTSKAMRDLRKGTMNDKVARFAC